MAELPDLEVFSHILTRMYGGKVLEKVDVEVKKKLNVSAKALKAQVEGHKLAAVKGSGRTLQLHFGEGRVLGLHLMLRGELVALENEQPRFPVLIFYFKGGDGFALTDMQKQATSTLNPPANNVPDAFELNYPSLKKILGGRRTLIETLLMDLKKIRGIGNSYSDEILYHAGISPFSVSGKIPGPEVKKLHKSMPSVLETAIKKIRKENGDELRGELRDFMEIHGKGIMKTKKGEEVLSRENWGKVNLLHKIPGTFA